MRIVKSVISFLITPFVLVLVFPFYAAKESYRKDKFLWEFLNL